MFLLILNLPLCGYWHFYIKIFLWNVILGGDSGDDSEYSLQATTVPDSDESSDGGDLAVVQPTPAPIHLLLVSLLEHICSLYVQDTKKRSQVFKGNIVASQEGYFSAKHTDTSHGFRLLFFFGQAS